MSDEALSDERLAKIVEEVRCAVIPNAAWVQIAVEMLTEIDRLWALDSAGVRNATTMPETIERTVHTWCVAKSEIAEMSRRIEGGSDVPAIEQNAKRAYLRECESMLFEQDRRHSAGQKQPAVPAPVDETPSPVVDLMESLEASVVAAREERKRH